MKQHIVQHQHWLVGEEHNENNTLFNINTGWLGKSIMKQHIVQHQHCSTSTLLVGEEHNETTHCSTSTLIGWGRA